MPEWPGDINIPPLGHRACLFTDTPLVSNNILVQNAAVFVFVMAPLLVIHALPDVSYLFLVVVGGYFLLLERKKGNKTGMGVLRA